MAAAKKREVEMRPQLDIQTATVENPLWSRAYDGDKTNHRFIKVEVNTRESSISALAAKGAINDAQVLAATQFRKLFEAMGGSGARAIDWRREAVDGGRFPDPIGEHQISAGKKLAVAYEHIVHEHGVYGWKLVGYICGEGRSIHELTETRRQRDTMTDHLRMCLDSLATHWGYRTNAHRAVRK